MTLRALAALLLVAATHHVSSKPQDFSPYNLYGSDDASSILQAAFAQAGVSLGDGIGSMPSFLHPTRKPTIWESSAARLRNSLKLPTFGRRKVPHMPMLVPIMGTLPKPLKLDGEEGHQLMQQLQANGHFLTAPPTFIQHHVHNPAASVSNVAANGDKKGLESLNYHIWSTMSQTVAPTTTTTPATPMSSEAVRHRLPVSLTRPRSVNHNYNSADNWTPTIYGGGFKPLSLDSASSSLIPTASAALVNYTDNYFQSTKRVSSYWDKHLRPSFTSASLQKTLDDWKNNSTSSSTIEELLKFHPIKFNEETNKIGLPISPTSLLEQINREASRRSVECKNKDLGWCDYSDNYPTHFVQAVVKECRDVIDRMYVEVPQNLQDFDDFVPFAPVTNSSGQLGKERATHATWSWAGYRSKNKALCDAERKFVRPSVAQDITGRWFVVVQSSLYHQQVPVDLCRNPGGVCNNIGECGTHARCVQKFHTQLLISIDLDKENDCPSMRLYRFPSGCVCDTAYYQ